VRDWFEVAMRREVVVRGLRVGAIVGTLLTAINQGNIILSGQLDASVASKILLTYLVPYCVSTYGGVSAIRAYEKLKSNA